MNRFTLLTLLVLLPTAALAQTFDTAGETPTNWLGLAAALIVPIASILAALLPDGHWLMKIVNMIAINVGKATNNPDSQ